MNITLYLEDSQLVLTDSLQEREPVYLYRHTVIPLLIAKIRREKIPRVYLYHHDPRQALEDIKKYFDVIEAAGGIVRNEKGEVLFIYRRGVWDLPKGKIEPGEPPERAALREVKEECGLSRLQNRGYFLPTYHLFKEGGRRKMKITHWFLMRASSDEILRPQGLEGIEKVAWISPGDNRLREKGKIYGSVRNILRMLDFWEA